MKGAPSDMPAAPADRGATCSEHLAVELGGGVRVAYAEYGDRDGAPVVFCHGWPSSRLQGRLLDRTGRDFGLRVICPDRPGCGESTFIPGRTLADWPTMLERFANAIAVDDFAVLGMSGGGPYALAAGQAMPERVRHVMLVCGAPCLGGVTDRREMLLPYRALIAMHDRAPRALDVALRIAELSRSWSVRHPVIRFLLRFVPPEDRCVMTTPDAQDCVLESYREALRGGRIGVLTDARVYLSDWGFPLEDVAVPVDLWHGARDRNIPVSMARSMAERLPNCRARWFDDEGHYSLAVRRCAEFAELMAERLASAGIARIESRSG